jgi:ATP-dependent RNA helicase MSS116
MFSATLPKLLRTVKQTVLGTHFVSLDTVHHPRGKRGASNQREHIQQTYLVLETMGMYVSKFVEIVMNAMQSTDDYKMLVFFATTKLVRFFADLFNAMEIPVLELHSRMSQSARQRTSLVFRESNRSVLFTSNVSARGMQYD